MGDHIRESYRGVISRDTMSFRLWLGCTQRQAPQEVMASRFCSTQQYWVTVNSVGLGFRV